MPGSALPLDDAVATAATGDVWLFRGRSLADVAIRALTEGPARVLGITPTAYRTRFTEIPSEIAASGCSPTARTRSPNGVR